MHVQACLAHGFDTGVKRYKMLAVIMQGQGKEAVTALTAPSALRSIQGA